MYGQRVRVFTIDLVPELVRTGRAHEEVSALAPNGRAGGSLAVAYEKILERSPGAVSDRSECFIGLAALCLWSAAMVSGRFRTGRRRELARAPG